MKVTTQELQLWAHPLNEQSIQHSARCIEPTTDIEYIFRNSIVEDFNEESDVGEMFRILDNTNELNLSAMQVASERALAAYQKVSGPKYPAVAAISQLALYRNLLEGLQDSYPSLTLAKVEDAVKRLQDRQEPGDIIEMFIQKNLQEAQDAWDEKNQITT